jgi:hypothetical protein
MSAKSNSSISPNTSKSEIKKFETLGQLLKIAATNYTVEREGPQFLLSGILMFLSVMNPCKISKP